MKQVDSHLCKIYFLWTVKAFSVLILSRKNGQYAMRIFIKESKLRMHISRQYGLITKKSD